MKKQKSKDAQCGQSLVEFAVILPLLLVVLFGMVEFSLVLYDKTMITNATREGARTSVLFRADAAGHYAQFTEAEVRAVVLNYLNNHLVTFGEGTVPTISAPQVGRGQVRTVTVTYNYRFLILPNFLALGNDVNLSSEARMRVE